MFGLFGEIGRLRRLFCLAIPIALSGCAHGVSPASWQSAFDEADQLFVIGEYDKAISGFEQAREIAPGDEERRASIFAEAASRVWGEDFLGARELLGDLVDDYRGAGDEDALNQAMLLYIFVLENLGESEIAEKLEEERAQFTGGLNPFIWRYDEESSLTTHLQTGMLFPQQIGAHYVSSFSQNDTVGGDVSAMYLMETTAGIDSISLELIFKPETPYSDFVDDSLTILYMYPGEPAYGDNFLFNLIRDGRAISVRRYNMSLDSFMGDHRPYRSDMWLIPVDNWAIRLFHTYPSSMATAADKAFEEFYQDLKWPSEFPELKSDLEEKEEIPDMDPALAALLEHSSEDFEKFRDDLVAMSEQADLHADQRGRAFRTIANGYWFGLDDKEKALEAAKNAAELLDDKFNGWWYLARMAQSAEKPKMAAEAIMRLMQEAPDRHSDIEPSLFWRVVRSLREMGAYDERLKLFRVAYEAGYNRGEPGGGADYIFAELVDLYLESGDVEEAAAFASEINSAGPWLSMALDRKYEPLWNSGSIDIDSIIRELPDTDTRVALNGAMDDPESISALKFLVETLHYTGQLAAAEKLVTTIAGNTKYYKGSDSDWYWFMNEAAYLFEDLEQFDRANQIMQSLANIDPQKDTDIVNQIINFGAMLVRQGDPERALEILSEIDGTKLVSVYGQGWIDSVSACAYETLSNPEAANAAAAKIVTKADENYAAAMRALLCRNRTDEAAALAIVRLQDDMARTGMLEAFANYMERAGLPAYEREMLARLKKVRDRPEVLAEISKYGRIVDFPLRRGYWGEF